MRIPASSRIAFGLAIGAVLFTGCGRGSRPEATTFELHDAWVRAAPDSGSTTAAYIRLVNGTADTVMVSHFTSDDATAVELHQTSIDSTGESRMTLRDALVIAPLHTVVMKPGGYHLMLIGTRRSLPAGRLVRIVMYLSNGAIVSTSARVKP